MTNDKGAQTITARQMADILFQRPGRVTEGVLEKRGLWEKTRDYWVTWNDTDRVSHEGLYGSWQKMRPRLFLEFSNVALVKEEHPRSLRKAMLELKALGFSNQQVAGIKLEFQRFIMSMQEYDTPLSRQLNKDFPTKVPVFCDTAFLGNAAYERSHGLDYKTMKTQAPANTLMTAESEELAYNDFFRMFESMAQTRPELFTPARPVPNRMKPTSP